MFTINHVILGHFLPFEPCNNPKKIRFWKNKKLLEILSFWTIVWCMVPEIWSTTDRIFLILDHFLPPPLPWQPKELKFWKNEKFWDIIILQKCTINDNHMIYIYIFLYFHIIIIFFLSSWAIFCPFTPPFPLNSPKIQNLRKMEIMPEDIIILQVLTKDYD